MLRKMIIDAANTDFIRSAVIDENNNILEFEQEISSHSSTKGNIYLAVVTRVEPSLQAAFINYGENMHGFLPFSEIHPDYFRIPVADKLKLLEEENATKEDDEEISEEVIAKRRWRLRKKYKIQEVINRDLILLVQLSREQRGVKGASLTTYLCIAGRYCVLKPNNARSGGVSRKITSSGDRLKLKKALGKLIVPDSMSVIIRTAGSKVNLTEIKKDFKYLVNTWNSIREKTLASHAPKLIHADGNLIIRSLRDLFDKSIDIVHIEGDQANQLSDKFLKETGADKVSKEKIQVYDTKEAKVPIFQHYKLEKKIAELFNSTIYLTSGGYIVIHQTEAMVTIDVNSGRSTNERDIEKTALKTNLEACREVANQIRLRDLAGLIVIDFIDMEISKNNRIIEDQMMYEIKEDRARIQTSRISKFGLMELSRQKMRSNIQNTITNPCPHCGGSGISVQSSWLVISTFRLLEEEIIYNNLTGIIFEVSSILGFEILNNYRSLIDDLTNKYEIDIKLKYNNNLAANDITIWKTAFKNSQNGEIVHLDPRSYIKIDFFSSNKPKIIDFKNNRRSKYKSERSQNNNSNYKGRDRFSHRQKNKNVVVKDAPYQVKRDGSSISRDVDQLIDAYEDSQAAAAFISIVDNEAKKTDIKDGDKTSWKSDESFNSKDISEQEDLDFNQPQQKEKIDNLDHTASEAEENQDNRKSTKMPFKSRNSSYGRRKQARDNNRDKTDKTDKSDKSDKSDKQNNDPQISPSEKVDSKNTNQKTKEIQTKNTARTKKTNKDKDVVKSANLTDDKETTSAKKPIDKGASKKKVATKKPNSKVKAKKITADLKEVANNKSFATQKKTSKQTKESSIPKMQESDD